MSSKRDGQNQSSVIISNAQNLTHKL